MTPPFSVRCLCPERRSLDPRMEVGRFVILLTETDGYTIGVGSHSPLFVRASLRRLR
jgi:hypothetical protein